MEKVDRFIHSLELPEGILATPTKPAGAILESNENGSSLASTAELKSLIEPPTLLTRSFGTAILRRE
jgi:hypothetical protein